MLLLGLCLRATLIWTKLPDYSRLRRVERLTAVVKDLDKTSPAHRELQGLLDEQSVQLAERLAPQKLRARVLLGLRNGAVIGAIIALIGSVAASLATALNGMQWTRVRGGWISNAYLSSPVPEALSTVALVVVIVLNATMVVIQVVVTKRKANPSPPRDRP